MSNIPFPLCVCVSFCYDRVPSKPVSPKQGTSEVDSRPHVDMTYRYKMDYPSLGQCIIINNKNFDRSTGGFLLM